MTTPHRRGKGGNRSTRLYGATVLAGDQAGAQADKPMVSRITSTGGKGAFKVECPVCGLPVRLRTDKRNGLVLVGHRVGSSHRNSWPCPGGGAPATPTVPCPDCGRDVRLTPVGRARHYQLHDDGPRTLCPGGEV